MTSKVGCICNKHYENEENALRNSCNLLLVKSSKTGMGWGRHVTSGVSLGQGQ